MTTGCAAVTSGNMSQRQAAKHYGVPRATLQKILDGKTCVGTKSGRKPLLGDLKNKLVDYAVNCASLGIGFGQKTVFRYAAQLAAKYKIKFKSRRQSQKWWRLLKKRNNYMCLRRPEPTAAVQHMYMNHIKVEKYFKALESLLMKTGLADRPEQVWNMDETSVQLEHKPRCVLAQKGTKFLHARTSGNRETLTVIACVNAAGESIPPHIIAKGKKSKSLHGSDVQSAPEGSTWSVSPSGWTKQGIAKLWFESRLCPVLAEKGHKF